MDLHLNNVSRPLLAALPLLCSCAKGSGGTGFEPPSGSATEGSSTGTTDTGTTSMGATSTGPGSASGPLGTSSPVTASSTGNSGGDCGTSWRVDLPGIAPRDAIVSDGVAYIVGSTTGGAAKVLALDTCDGAQLGDAEFIHGTDVASGLNAVTLAPSGLYVAGWTTPAGSESVGLYARLDPAPLDTVWTAPIAGTADKQDQIYHVAALDTGRLWMAGKVSSGPTQRPWWINGSDLGQACGFTWGGAGDMAAASARVVAVDDMTVYTVVNRPEGIQLLQFDPTCTCQCAPTVAGSIVTVGAAATVALDGALLSGTLFVSGTALDDAMTTNYRRFTAALDAATGAMTAVSTSNPSLLYDQHLTITAGATTLYTGSVTNWDGSAGYGGGQARLAALNLPLINGASPAWETAVDGMNAATDVTWDPTQSALIVVGPAGADGLAVRCDTLGGCG